MKRIISFPRLCASVAVLFCAHSANAALLVYESFNYTTGQSLTGQNGGTGFSGAWGTSSSTSTITAPGSTYTNLSTAGDKVTLTPTATDNTSRTLSTPIPITDGSSIFISFLAQNTNGGTRFDLLTLSSGATGRLSIGQNGGGSGTVWGISGNGGTLATNSAASSLTLSLLVVEIDFSAASNETIKLFVNPTSNVAPTPTFTATNINIPVALDTITIGSGFTASTFTTVNATFDEIRVGTTFADVSPVPEPSTVALGLLGVGAVAVRAMKKVTRRA